MAFSDARKELDCSICLHIYTNPVTLRCGHNFCQECIEDVLDRHGRSGIYCCPECREQFQVRPQLSRNITLRNIVESFRSTAQEKKEEKKESQIFCTQCIHSPVIAVKSCLHCEASLCDDHLRVHSKSPQHVLSDLTTPQKNRKCSVHEKILEYYCTEDSACLCGSCRLHGDHQEHQVEALEEASEKRKENLTNALQKLVKKREEMEESIKSLQKYKRKVQDDADGVTKRVTAIFRDIRRQLDILEKRILNKISRQAEKASFPPSDLIQDLEIKKDNLSRKIRHIEEICNMTDPLTFLQESDTGDLCDTEDEEDKERRDKLLHGGGELDVTGISHTLHTGLYDIITGVNKGINIPEPAEITLDEDTAHNNVYLLDDKKTACRITKNLNRPQLPNIFTILPQVMSSQSFSSGRHYWDVDVGGSSQWRVGMCFPSIDKAQYYADLGNNPVSWCLERNANQLLVKHGYKSATPLAGNASVTKVRISLDYEAGQISFYELVFPIRHLHTFTGIFTEPMHAALYLGEGCIKICRENQEL
ncbi:putative tripartite motif-containing protein 75 isoform X2 [Rana temporaria]|uniref:putative tripartite motif-containing protein 75 isoform X2 n=1 Tax=Rana temporaria TaxID=8407 RepID=UPI001AAD777D|nr:putative tripartite motif-containing protein 75 isoform X2 [Rana temporaria]